MYPDFCAPIRLRASGNTSHVHSSDVVERGLKPATTCLTVMLSQVCSRGLQPAFHHVSTAATTACFLVAETARRGIERLVSFCTMGVHAPLQTSYTYTSFAS